ncbi:MAG: hypothetical protein AAF652_07755 [Cyanobacteria bacterium P01_C01_bin.72]
MKTGSKYWNLVRLDSSGKLKITAISTVKQFFQQQFAPLLDEEKITDSLLQKDLAALKNSQDQNKLLAERCLRCFISHQIRQACILLEIQFGKEHGFSRYDLFIYTLTDTFDNFRDGVSPQARGSKYKPLAVEIIATFNPDRASLSTWTNRYVRQHRELQLFLLEQGVYLISNWAILNDTKVKQVERVLAEFHNLTATEIEQAAILLSSYHQIYRRDRLKNRQNKGQKCQTPTTEQLESIANLIEQQTNSALSAPQTLTLLEKLAEQLREYRIYVRGGKTKQESLDNISYAQAAKDVEPEESPDRGEFLKSYQQEFKTSLDTAIEAVISDRLSKFKGKKAAKKNQFITALELFHCQGESMSAIAPKINLQAQYQVTRLLKLKELRTDIRHQMLQKLKDWTTQQQNVPTLLDLASLQQRDREIESALGAQIDLVLEEAEKEVSVANSTASLLARRICHYLDSILT